MRLDVVSLTDFRNYADQRIEFGDADVQVFLGHNGSGKTNILEAISMLSLGRSCRGHDDLAVVRWDQNFYRIRCDMHDDDAQQTLEVVTEVLPRRRKAVFRNDVRIGLSQLIGTLPTVLFLPQDLTLFSGQPGERRRFLDQMLCQMSPRYFQALSQYQRVIKQRNALLKRIASSQASVAELDTWDREVAELGAEITVARLALLETLNLSFALETSTLGEAWQDARLAMIRKTQLHAREDLVTELLHLLQERHTRDVLLQATSVGPHRDDWQAYSGERLLASFASRGQERTAVLALLLLQVSYMELHGGTTPIILLDDVFSELDDRHQQAIVERFRGHQTLITATHLPPDTQTAAIYDVERGVCTRRA